MRMLFPLCILLASLNVYSQGLFSKLSFDSGSSSSLNMDCKQNNFSCGECETPLQDDLNQLMNRITNGGLTQGDHWGEGRNTNPANIKIDSKVTLEKTLEEIIGLFKKHNPVGENKLNFVVIGESESLQATSVRDGKIYPRIMLKSPNSELMVTFNTDPNAKGYKTIEMMRWNGKQGKYEFQELNFGDGGEEPHVDTTGTKCLECHKSPSPRPNWDTYRAWAGVVPSRDDMLEMHAQDGEFDTSKGMQPDARAYINFLDQVAQDKDSGAKTRLSMLEIPFDEKRQMSEYVMAAGKTNLTNREKIDLIKKKIDDTGFYRIRHFPDKEEAEDTGAIKFNFDNKTAPWAGPSQFAFDQMLAQNMCKVATDLKKHPDFDKFKNALALMLKCGQVNRMENIYPQEFKDKAINFYEQNRYRGLTDLPPSSLPQTKTNFNQMIELLERDTAQSHERADGYKFNRHERFLNKYLTTVENFTPAKAQTDAHFYSEEVVSPVQDNFHAIDDVGGVKGVPESATKEIANVRLLLEPFGVDVSHWSLVHGKDNATNSFSFSDQFQLFESQPMLQEILDEAGSCAELEVRARDSLSTEISRAPAMNSMSTSVQELALMCNSSSALDLSENMSEIGNAALFGLKTDVKNSMSKCVHCHGVDSEIEFPGLKAFIKTPEGMRESEADQEFLSFLNSKNETYNRSTLEVVQIKLGLLERPKDLDFGRDMPPTDWKDNATYGATHQIEPQKVQEARRKQMALYLSFAASAGNRDQMRAFCNKINNDSGFKEINISSPRSQSRQTEAQ